MDSTLYLISGNETLLVQEARDRICKTAEKNGYREKQIIHIESGFCPEILASALQNQSLFCEKNIIDVRNPAAKFESATLHILEKFIKNPENQIVIISTDKLTSAQHKTPWFTLIKTKGVYLPIWPITVDKLPRWIIERGEKFNLKITLDAAKFLTHFCEGNLLSAHQAIEKCSILYPESEITRKEWMTVLADHARFNVFDLSQTLFTGNIQKISRILHKLEQTGEEPVLVLWAICRQLREKNPAHMKRALQYAASVDEIIKGAKTGSVWDALLELCLLSGSGSGSGFYDQHFQNR